MKSADWRALVHGLVLGRLAYSSRSRHQELDLSHLRDANTWMRQRNVVGVCVARKVSKGRFGPLCLQVLVAVKREKRSVPPERFIPRYVDARPLLPTRKLPTDVRAVGVPSPDSLISGERPTRPGFAIGGEAGGFGTIGCTVRDSTDRLLGLSCAHVIADDGRAQPGARVFVPGPDEAQDFGVDDPDFGELVDTGTIGFGANDTATNLDAALFAPDDAAALLRKVALWGRVPTDVATSVSSGQAVFKVGASSEKTTGCVVGRFLSIKVPYTTSNAIRSATFLDQIGISPFTREGDSGSLVLTEHGRAVGLHFASADGMSICTPIGTVLSRFGVTLA